RRREGRPTTLRPRSSKGQRGDRVSWPPPDSMLAIPPKAASLPGQAAPRHVGLAVVGADPAPGHRIARKHQGDRAVDASRARDRDLLEIEAVAARLGDAGEL